MTVIPRIHPSQGIFAETLGENTTAKMGLITDPQSHGADGQFSAYRQVPLAQIKVDQEIVTGTGQGTITADELGNGHIHQGQLSATARLFTPLPPVTDQTSLVTEFGHCQRLVAATPQTGNQQMNPPTVVILCGRPPRFKPPKPSPLGTVSQFRNP